MNDILTKQAVKISLLADEGGATESEQDEFLILSFSVSGRRVYLEPFQHCFQLAAVTFCQLLSHLHHLFMSSC